MKAYKILFMKESRAAEADEVAGTVVYLASDQSCYTTGTDIIVDRGYLSHCPRRT